MQFDKDINGKYAEIFLKLREIDDEKINPEESVLLVDV